MLLGSCSTLYSLLTELYIAVTGSIPSRTQLRHFFLTSSQAGWNVVQLCPWQCFNQKELRETGLLFKSEDRRYLGSCASLWLFVMARGMKQESSKWSIKADSHVRQHHSECADPICRSDPWLNLHMKGYVAFSALCWRGFNTDYHTVELFIVH